MSKSILVIDTPTSCRDCIARSLSDDCTATYKSVAEYRYNKNKPDWCPLKGLPQRANHPDYCDNGRYDKGWNDCIDEILGEKKE